MTRRYCKPIAADMVTQFQNNEKNMSEYLLRIHKSIEIMWRQDAQSEKLGKTIKAKVILKQGTIKHQRKAQSWQ